MTLSSCCRKAASWRMIVSATIGGKQLFPTLAKRLVDGDADAGREVERSNTRRQDWHRDKPIAISLVKLGRQPPGLTAEDQRDISADAERRVPYQSRRLGREEIRVAERRQLALERLPVRPDAHVDMLPIVEAGALDLTFVERKAERCDEVQHGARGETGSACITGVPVNLGVDEHDVDCQLAAAPLSVAGCRRSWNPQALREP